MADERVRETDGEDGETEASREQKGILLGQKCMEDVARLLSKLLQTVAQS